MTPEQQFQQMTETAKEMPGDLQWLAYILFAIGVVLIIMGVRKSLRYFKLDELERISSGRGTGFYLIAFFSLLGAYFAHSMGHIASMLLK